MSSRLAELSGHNNNNAEIVSKAQARAVNVAAAVGLMEVLKSNLGPRGTLKMLVGGAGQIKLTKDGQVLLKEMQIQHPTACLVARTATAQDDVTGDGTTSTVLLCGELLKQAERICSEGLHPRVVTDGFDLARDCVLGFLEKFKVPLEAKAERELLYNLAFTSLQTKLDTALARNMTDAVVDAIQTISSSSHTSTTTEEDEQKQEQNEFPLDLNRIEIMSMPKHGMGTDSRFINGLVLDHGARHPDMPRLLKNCRIMTCNVSLEYEATEVQSGFFYSTAQEREKLVESERKWLDQRCKQVVEFKRSVCQEGESFVIINQKGVDPLSLDIFAKEGILCLRRAKRRNMERLTLACGGSPIHSLEDLSEDMLGYAGKVSEVTLGDDEKYTFVEECRNSKSCTLLLKGPNQHSIDQIKDAVRDGLRSLKNAIEDKAVVPGAGAFELAASMHLEEILLPQTKGRAKLGIRAFQQALLIIPKTLAENSGLDVQECLLELQQERQDSPDIAIGLDCESGQPMLPTEQGVWDCVRVKRQSLHLATILANQLLLVDEVMRAGKQMGRVPPGAGDMQ